jgi:hypothetical protein
MFPLRHGKGSPGVYAAVARHNGAAPRRRPL